MNDLQIFSLAIAITSAMLLIAKELQRRGMLPVTCALCHNLVQKRHSFLDELTTGSWTRVCGQCHEHIYHPFTEGR